MAASRSRAATILTLIVVIMWIVSAIVRIWMSWPAAAVLDSAMPIVIGYWFVIGPKKNGTAA